MTDAVNYVCREGRYVMIYYLVAVISVWPPPSGFQHSNVKHAENAVFIIFYSRLLLILHCSFLNCKKGNVLYNDGVPNSKMSDVKNIYCVYRFISDAQSQVIRDARFCNTCTLDCGSEPGTVQQAPGNVSLFQQKMGAFLSHLL